MIPSTFRRIAFAALALTLAAPAARAAGTQAPPLNGIAHIAIRVHDIAASSAFYKKLGFEQPFQMTRNGVTTQAFIKLNDRQFIELYPVTPRDPQIGFLHLCFEGADLYAIHDYYVANGLTPISVRTAGAGNLLFTLKGPQQPDFLQNMEYTQYMPASMHSKDFGKDLGPDRVAGKMVIVSLAMQDPAAARAFYIDKLGFTPSSKDPMLLNLPGASGEQVEIVPAQPLGPKASITLTTPSLSKSETELKKLGIPFTKEKNTLTIADPDGNIIHIEPARG